MSERTMLVGVTTEQRFMARQWAGAPELSEAQRNLLLQIADADTDPDLALWFTPDAIALHFELDDDGRGRWVESATAEQLAEVGETAVVSEILYRTFHECLVLAVEEQLGEISEIEK